MTGTVAMTRQGAVRGVTNDGTISWRGIRYAAPPTGALRWQAPQPAEPWEGILDVTTFPTRAPQVLAAELVPPGGATPSDDDSPMGEDCLFLNITAPTQSANSPCPVLVWFHGGGYTWGSGANFIGDGTALALEGTIVVTVNYRLGALGFLKLDHLLGEQYASSANAGLLDQIAALKWVRDNVAAFGGDPSRITIAGVSAGAKSVVNLMASPMAEGLFHRGIIQSGGEHLNTPDTAEQVTAALLRTLGLSPADATELLTMPVETILAAQQEIAAGVRATWVWRPTVDGLILPEAPVHAFAKGRARGINIMAGVTANEAGSYDLADPCASQQSPRVLQEIFGDEAEQVLDIYRSAFPEADERRLHCAVLADERYGIPTIRLLDSQSEHASCWRYRFDAPSPGAPKEKWGFHGADVPFVWDIGLEAAEPALQTLASGIRQAWTTFIHHGKPESHDLPFWPEYRRTERWTMLLDTTPTVVPDPRQQQRQVWESAEWQPDTWWTFPALHPAHNTTH
ncbi:para-nitrobenzyl esterase [Arthrobacter sp. AG367]|uniref:carboxylesterase/lipase family protein n=1 Tax=Arthrobacter sp. AG367 TaxID=2572909 RepID=UPI0011A6C399|nr:carboxylesterase/lipase family protein [Arthrobacter sp. AG367]TWD56101.1 para-nitrobenzyl esterase [Arthrobacter sp. AG367]